VPILLCSVLARNLTQMTGSVSLMEHLLL